MPVFVVFLISKDFFCGFIRTLALLSEGYNCIELYVLVISRTRFRVNSDYIVA